MTRVILTGHAVINIVVLFEDAQNFLFSPLFCSFLNLTSHLLNCSPLTHARKL